MGFFIDAAVQPDLSPKRPTVFQVVLETLRLFVFAHFFLFRCYYVLCRIYVDWSEFGDLKVLIISS